jgi:hypothetical protein
MSKNESLESQLEQASEKNKARALEPENLLQQIEYLKIQVGLQTEEVKEVSGRNLDLDSRIRNLEMRQTSKRTAEKALYIIPSIVIVAFTTFLVSKGWAETPEVTIDFNVGEIVGGLLGGLGILVGGIAYAFRGIHGD